MKVPTYHKFGLTKAQIEKSESQDKKISDILTHHLTVGIGIAFGMVIYIIYFNKVKPDTFIQIVMQVFLFASLGVICVGIPAVLFKMAEMFYFKHIKHKTVEHKTIMAYKEEREDFDFWKLRRDYSFWRYLDGLSFEKEIMNIYMHLGYELKDDMFSEENPNDRIIHNNERNYYLSFNTMHKEISEVSAIDALLSRMQEHNCDELLVFSQMGFHKKVVQYAHDKPAELFDINGLVKLARTIKTTKPAEKKAPETEEPETEDIQAE